MKKFNQMTEVQMSKTKGGFIPFSLVATALASVLGTIGFVK